MKKIFSEGTAVFDQHPKRVRASIAAYCDEEQHVFCADLECVATVDSAYATPEPPKNVRVLETQECESAAIRRAVALMDEWRMLVAMWAEENGPRLRRRTVEPFCPFVRRSGDESCHRCTELEGHTGEHRSGLGPALGGDWIPYEKWQAEQRDRRRFSKD